MDCLREVKRLLQKGECEAECEPVWVAEAVREAERLGESAVRRMLGECGYE